MKFLTESDVAKILDCSKKTVAAMCKAGKIPYLKVGNERRIPEDQLERVLRDMVENECGGICGDPNAPQRVGGRPNGKPAKSEVVESVDFGKLRKIGGT